MTSTLTTSSPEVLGMAAQVVELVEAVVQVWVWVWVKVRVRVQVLASEQEGLDCHNQHCFDKPSLHHCHKLAHFPRPDKDHNWLRHPICSSNSSQPKLDGLQVQGAAHA
jgi:hypothetical protein